MLFIKCWYYVEFFVDWHYFEWMNIDSFEFEWIDFQSCNTWKQKCIGARLLLGQIQINCLERNVMRNATNEIL